MHRLQFPNHPEPWKLPFYLTGCTFAHSPTKSNPIVRWWSLWGVLGALGGRFRSLEGRGWFLGWAVHKNRHKIIGLGRRSPGPRFSKQFQVAYNNNLFYIMLCQNYSFANYITHNIEEVKPGKSMTLQEELQVAQLQVCSCPLSFFHFFHSFFFIDAHKFTQGFFFAYF